LAASPACTDGVFDSGSEHGAAGAHPRGGTVVFGLLGQPRTLDPYAESASELTYVLARPVWPSLYRFTPDGTPKPYLARSLQESAGGVRIRLDDATWSNGRPITAADVAASAARARPPSGFAGLRASRVNGRTVELEGRSRDWEQQLARLTFVLPRGRTSAASVSGGPFLLSSYEPGFEAVYERNSGFWGSKSNLDTVKVRFVDSIQLLLGLLEDEKVDAASLPSAINLDERLEADGLRFDDELGWETLRIDFSRSLPRSERVGLARLLDRPELESFFIRDDGRLANTLHPAPGPGGADGPWSGAWGQGAAPDAASIGASAGDQLAQELQRAIFERLHRAGLEVDSVPIDPSELHPPSPSSATIVRRSGSPGLTDRRDALKEFDSLPLAQVETVVAWNKEVGGLRANPTFEGPLWNAEDWFVTSP
jgi:Bacterial extracellular solute-binding proteins, family 5 Middle